MLVQYPCSTVMIRQLSAESRVYDARPMAFEGRTSFPELSSHTLPVSIIANRDEQTPIGTVGNFGDVFFMPAESVPTDCPLFASHTRTERSSPPPDSSDTGVHLEL